MFFSCWWIIDPFLYEPVLHVHGEETTQLNSARLLSRIQMRHQSAYPCGGLIIYDIWTDRLSSPCVLPHRHPPNWTGHLRFCSWLFKTSGERERERKQNIPKIHLLRIIWSSYFCFYLGHEKHKKNEKNSGRLFTFPSISQLCFDSVFSRWLGTRLISHPVCPSL